MRNSLIYSLFLLPIYFYLAIHLANELRVFEDPILACYACMYIAFGGVLYFALTTFVFELLDKLNNWTIKLSSPFRLSQKDFLIILTQKDTIVAYYQYAQTFFKQVFSIQNQTLHSQALYFAKHSHNKYSWEEYPQIPNKRTQNILHKVISLFIKEDLHPIPQILNAKSLISSPLYLPLVQKIGKDEFFELFSSSNPQFSITPNPQWTPKQKKIILREGLKTFLVFAVIAISLYLVWIFFFEDSFRYITF